MSQPFVLLSVTWSADKGHFALLRESLRFSQFAEIPHHVVVQSEDVQLFTEFGASPVNLMASADILPSLVEQRRCNARTWQKRLGRRGVNLAGSLARYLGGPQWVRYTGWHTQQLTKLAFVAASPADNVVIMDSDLIVTRHASAEDFISPEKIVCYRKMLPVQKIGGKVLHWQQTANAVFGGSFIDIDEYDGYYDTPFVMHAPTVRAMLQLLENTYQRPWWQTLVMLPPRRWSEFGIYKQYLRKMQQNEVDWRAADIAGYLFDASDPVQLANAFDVLVEQQKCHYVTIHSQSSGRQLWSVEDYQERIKECLERGPASHPAN